MFEQHINYLMNGICYDAPADKGAGSSDGGDSGKASVNNGTPKKEYNNIASELKDTFNKFKEGYLSEAEYKQREEKINERLDELDMRQQTMAKPQGKADNKGLIHKDTFKKAFWSFVKRNNREGLTLGSLADENNREAKSYHPSLAGETKSDNLVRFDFASTGALLMPAEMSEQILYNAIESTPITRLVNTTMTSRSQKKRNLRVSTPGINWVEEEGTTPKGKIKYRQVTLTPKKAAARYGASIENEQDSGHDLFAEMRMAYEEDFRKSIGKECLSGDGNGKPKGMIGELTAYESGGLSLTSDMLIEFVETILDVYQENAQWLFTRETRAYIRKLLVTDEATSYLWEPDFTRRSPTLLLGAPINIAAKGDMAGSLGGDFTAGQVPVLFGDFNTAYEFTTHTDMFVIDDPYTESEQWIRNLNIMSRVDGQPMKTEAAAELRITTP